MTNCNSQKFPSTCIIGDYGHKEFFMNTGEEVYYQKITGSNLPEDGVVIILKNGEYYKAILYENTINIEWYRCNGRYPNDEAIILAAVKMAAYLGATLRFDAREYVINQQLVFHDLSCFKLLGDKQHTVIKSNTDQRFSSYYLRFIHCNNFMIDGIRIDQNMSKISQVYTETDYNNAGSDDTLRDFNGGIYITDSTDIEIINCSFLNLYTRGLQFYNCNTDGEIKITDNYFESEIQTQMYRMEHLSLTQSHNINFTIENNVFRNKVSFVNNKPVPDPAHMPCGIFANDCGYVGSLFINNNYFEFCGRNNEGKHRLFAIDFYDDVNNVVITNNILKNTTWGAIRFDGTRKNITIAQNIIHQLISEGGDGGIIAATSRNTRGSESYFKNISICNNVIEAVSARSFGISLQSQYDEVIAENITIENNNFDNVQTAALIIGKINNVNISNNVATNVSGTVIDFRAYTTVNTLDSNGNIISSTNKVSAPLGKVSINNNNFGSSGVGGGFVGVQIDGVAVVSSQQNLDLYKNSTKRFVISDNIMHGNMKGYGIIINSINEIWPPKPGKEIIGRSLDGNVTISGNEINDVGNGIYLRCYKTITKDNILFDCSQNPILEDYTNNIKFDNYYNNTPI